MQRHFFNIFVDKYIVFSCTVNFQQGSTESPKKNGAQMKISFLLEKFLLIEGGNYIDRR